MNTMIGNASERKINDVITAGREYPETALFSTKKSVSPTLMVVTIYSIIKKTSVIIIRRELFKGTKSHH
jgi:hypothetical protein